jgi:hypothetical protein
VLQKEEVISIKNTLIFINYSTNFDGGGVELMLTAFTNGLALDGAVAMSRCNRLSLFHNCRLLGKRESATLLT